MHFRRRTDNNQAELIKALRRVGLEVLLLYRQGEGCPDALVSEPYGATSRCWLLEIKNHGGKRTEAQDKFLARWRGVPVITAETPEAVLNLIGWCKSTCLKKADECL